MFFLLAGGIIKTLDDGTPFLDIPDGLGIVLVALLIVALKLIDMGVKRYTHHRPHRK